MALSNQIETFSSREWLSPKEVAGILNFNVKTLLRARQGELKGPPWYQIGGRIYYKRSELVEWIRAQRHDGS